MNQNVPHRVHRGAAIERPHSPHDGNTSCSTQNHPSYALVMHALCYAGLSQHSVQKCSTVARRFSIQRLSQACRWLHGQCMRRGCTSQSSQQVAVSNAKLAPSGPQCGRHIAISYRYVAARYGLVFSAMYTVLHDSLATAHALIWQASRTCAQLMRGHGRPSIHHCDIDHCRTGIGS